MKDTPAYNHGWDEVIQREITEGRPLTPSSQHHIEKCLRDFDLFAAEQTTDGAFQTMDTPHHREPMRAFLSSSLHQLAEAQKEKALEIVRRRRQPNDWTGSPEHYETIGYNQALSEVEEAIKKEL